MSLATVVPALQNVRSFALGAGILLTMGPAEIVLPELLEATSLRQFTVATRALSVKAEFFQRACGDIANLLMYVPPTVQQVEIVSLGDDEARQQFMSSVDKGLYKKYLDKIQALRSVRLLVTTKDRKVLDEIEADWVRKAVPARVQLTVESFASEKDFFYEGDAKFGTIPEI